MTVVNFKYIALFTFHRQRSTLRQAVRIQWPAGSNCKFWLNHVSSPSLDNRITKLAHQWPEREIAGPALSDIREESLARTISKRARRRSAQTRWRPPDQWIRGLRATHHERRVGREPIEAVMLRRSPPRRSNARTSRDVRVLRDANAAALAGLSTVVPHRASMFGTNSGVIRQRPLGAPRISA